MVLVGSRIDYQGEALAKLSLSIFIVHGESIRNDQSNYSEKNMKCLSLAGLFLIHIKIF